MIESTYIHIPFCKKICSYCDFCKMFYNEELFNKYLKSLEKEIKINYKNEKQKTIYIGGGTPSCIGLDNLDKLFKVLDIIKLDIDYEFTIEMNVQDINEELLVLLKKNKINRISIGIETINEKFYKLINRYNDKHKILDQIKLSKKYFDNINIDLMYGFPDETIEDLKNDLDFFKELDVKHISIYSLIIEKNTKLFIDGIRNIDESLERKMYYYIIDYLKKIGFNQYEISNFSKENYYSKHNTNYWNNNLYYGFGLGASGYIEDYRYTNTRSINNYIKGNYILDKEKITKEIKMEEELICGLRKTSGISKKRFQEKYNRTIEEVFDIKGMIKKGYLKEEEDNIYIPEDKLYVSNSILLNFIM